MPIPMEYQHASEVFEQFLAIARERSGLTTRNQTWTMADGVFRVFRRRLTVAEGLRFAAVLPPVLRAMFVVDWDIEASPVAFADRATATEEVRSLRVHHNFAPDSAIVDVATALRGVVDEAELDRVLAELPTDAIAFWAV